MVLLKTQYINTQHGLDFGGENLQVEGLGQQVVAAQLHSHDGIDAVPGGSQKQNGHLGDLADFLAPVIAVEKGQGDVQQHQLGVEGGKLLKHPVEFLGAADRVAPALQMTGYGTGNDLIILYQKNAISQLYALHRKLRAESVVRHRAGNHHWKDQTGSHCLCKFSLRGDTGFHYGADFKLLQRMELHHVGVASGHPPICHRY